MQNGGVGLIGLGDGCIEIGSSYLLNAWQEPESAPKVKRRTQPLAQWRHHRLLQLCSSTRTTMEKESSST